MERGAALPGHMIRPNRRRGARGGGGAKSEAGLLASHASVYGTRRPLSARPKGAELFNQMLRRQRAEETRALARRPPAVEEARAWVRAVGRRGGRGGTDVTRGERPTRIRSL